MDSLEIALLTNLQKNHHFTVEKLKDKRIMSMSIKEMKFFNSIQNIFNQVIKTT